MPLRDDLLEPITADNPSGEDLRWDPIRAEIKEALREDDPLLNQGAWATTLKKADLSLAIKLASDGLARRSKDLWLVAFLAEAQFRREGLAALAPVLTLLLQIQECFWETCFPKIDPDGDSGARVAPVQQMANRLTGLLALAPATSSGLKFYQFAESRAIGYEKDAENNDVKKALREQAIAEKKPTAEDFDSAVNRTPRAFYEAADASLRESLRVIDSLNRFHLANYGKNRPMLGALLDALPRVNAVVSNCLPEKQEEEHAELAPQTNDEVKAATAQPEAGGAQTDTVVPARAMANVEPTVTPVRRTEIADDEDAFESVKECAAFLRDRDASSPIPYLLLSAIRLGELRKQGTSPDPDFLVAPSKEVRQSLLGPRRERNWHELLSKSISALGNTCARAWLDIHHFVWVAADATGAYSIKRAVTGNVRSALLDFPEMPGWTLDDGTPAASQETRKWIDSEILPPLPTRDDSPAEKSAPMSAIQPTEQPSANLSNGTGDVDAYHLALQILESGERNRAVALLTRESENQSSGRSRFQRRIQLAELCLAAGNYDVAYPILTHLWQEAERRNLESWESADLLVRPLALMLKCLDRETGREDDRKVIFNHLCRIDASSAMCLTE